MVKKILALLFITVITSLTASSGKVDTPTSFNSSMRDFNTEADSLNHLIKKYNNEKQN